jgi:hypothetical protein
LENKLKCAALPLLFVCSSNNDGHYEDFVVPTTMNKIHKSCNGVKNFVERKIVFSASEGRISDIVGGHKGLELE